MTKTIQKTVRVPDLGLESQVWSPFNRQHYSVQLEDGNQIGIGLNPIFEVIYGAWNLLWLTWPGLDDYAWYEGDPRKFPVDAEVLAYVAGSCLQYARPPIRYGYLAETLAPLEFLAKMTEYSNVNSEEFLMLKLFGPNWLDQAKARAIGCQAATDKGSKGKIIPFNTSRRVQ